MAGLPSKLKNFITFVDGGPMAGLCSSLKLPVLSRQMEDYRGGGMSGPVKTDMGMQGLEVEHKYGGFVPAIFSSFGAPTHDATMIRFAGAYQSDSSALPMAVEVIMRGRHEEIDGGDSEAGKDTELTVKTTCSYYKLSVNRQTLVEIDFVNMIEIIDGVDRLAAIRAALLLA
ncbi:phage major tail tube protein [Sphingomonas oryzagri]